MTEECASQNAFLLDKNSLSILGMLKKQECTVSGETAR